MKPVKQIAAWSLGGHFAAVLALDTDGNLWVCEFAGTVPGEWVAVPGPGEAAHPAVPE